MGLIGRAAVVLLHIAMLQSVLAERKDAHYEMWMERLQVVCDPSSVTARIYTIRYGHSSDLTQEVNQIYAGSSNNTEECQSIVGRSNAFNDTFQQMQFPLKPSMCGIEQMEDSPYGQLYSIKVTVVTKKNMFVLGGSCLIPKIRQPYQATMSLDNGVTRPKLNISEEGDRDAMGNVRNFTEGTYVIPKRHTIRGVFEMKDLPEYAYSYPLNCWTNRRDDGNKTMLIEGGCPNRGMSGDGTSVVSAVSQFTTDGSFASSNTDLYINAYPNVVGFNKRDEIDVSPFSLSCQIVACSGSMKDAIAFLPTCPSMAACDSKPWPKTKKEQDPSLWANTKSTMVHSAAAITISAMETTNEPELLEIYGPVYISPIYLCQSTKDHPYCNVVNQNWQPVEQETSYSHFLTTGLAIFFLIMAFLCASVFIILICVHAQNKLSRSSRFCRIRANSRNTLMKPKLDLPLVETTCEDH